MGDVGATHYERLGVARSASPAEIRVAYRTLARRNHPDVVDGAADVDMVAVNEAWRVLGDDARRAAYDATLPSLPSPASLPPTITEPIADDLAATTIEADADDAEDWRLDVPITDGRAVRTFGLMVAVAGGLALIAVVALFTYAILRSG